MERLIRIAASSGSFYAAVLVFTIGILLYSTWALCCKGERLMLKKTAQLIAAFGLEMFFVGCYADVVNKGLHGVTAVSSRYSAHVTPVFHQESPVQFWLFVGFNGSIFALFALVCLGYMLHVVVKNSWLFFGILGVSVLAPLAWMAFTFHRIDVAKAQVTSVMAFASRAKAAVESYYRIHHKTPDDNATAGLPAPTEMHGRYVSEVRVVAGSIYLGLDGRDTDKHLRGRHLILVLVRSGSASKWSCMSTDIENRYLTAECLSVL